MLLSYSRFTQNDIVLSLKYVRLMSDVMGIFIGIIGIIGILIGIIRMLMSFIQEIVFNWNPLGR